MASETVICHKTLTEVVIALMRRENAARAQVRRKGTSQLKEMFSVASHQKAENLDLDQANECAFL